MLLGKPPREAALTPLQDSPLLTDADCTARPRPQDTPGRMTCAGYRASNATQQTPLGAPCGRPGRCWGPTGSGEALATKKLSLVGAKEGERLPPECANSRAWGRRGETQTELLENWQAAAPTGERGVGIPGGPGGPRQAWEGTGHKQSPARARCGNLQILTNVALRAGEQNS